MARLINDAIYGLVEFSEMQEQLLEQPELQRLAWIRQLGIAQAIYPGAHNTRLEHAIGVSHLAGRIARALNTDQNDVKLLQAAGLLHDIGHSPFSHALEHLMPIDHMEYTKKLITGKETLDIPNAGRIPSILEKHGVSPRDAAALICSEFKTRSYIQTIIHGEIDADQLDYLVRDAHYTGINAGVTDTGRLISTMRIHENKICFLEKAIDAIEEYIVARDHAYSSIYYHHTKRIAEVMLRRAMKSAISDLPDFYQYTDNKLLERLQAANEYAEEMVSRIIYRNLYKRAFEVSSKGVTPVQMKKLEKLCKIGEDETEKQIASLAGVKQRHVIADIIVDAIRTREDPRLKRFEIPILMQDGAIKSLDSISELAKALGRKEFSRSLLLVYAPAEHKEKVGKATAEFFKTL